MKGRASWVLYGMFALCWACFFGWRTYQNAENNAHRAQVQAEVDARAQSSQGPVRAAGDAEKIAARRCIVSQLDAFKKDDYNTAASYQSSSLRSIFSNIAQFRTMIRANYPQFANYKSAVLGHALCDKDGSHLSVAVSLTGADGKHVGAVYDLVREEGSYRVAGVSTGTLRPPHGSVPPSDSEALVA